MPDTPNTETFYVVYDDGSIEQLTMTGTGPLVPVLDKPGRITSKAEYDQYKTVMDERHAIYLAELSAAEQSTMRTDYDALIAAGMPDATARRLSGYTGP